MANDSKTKEGSEENYSILTSSGYIQEEVPSYGVPVLVMSVTYLNFRTPTYL